MNNYVYIFTRQDMSAEQQIVQTAHATYKLGDRQMIGPPEWKSGQLPWSNPNYTHFTLVGVRNLEALEAVKLILDEFDFYYEIFSEEDMNDELTSIAVYPIPADKRGPLLAFNLLKVK